MRASSSGRAARTTYSTTQLIPRPAIVSTTVRNASTASSAVGAGAPLVAPAARGEVEAAADLVACEERHVEGSGQLQPEPRLPAAGLAGQQHHSRPANAGPGHAAERSRMWTPQAEPRPMTWARPTLAPSIWRSPASPRRWWQISQMLAMPVAAIGWPLDSRPPDTFTGVEPSRQVAPGLEEVDGVAGLAEHEVVVVHQLGGGEAVVELHEVEVLGGHAGGLVGLGGGDPGEGVDVREDLAGLLVRVGGEHRRRHLHGPTLLLVAMSDFSRSPDTTTAAAAPSQLAEHIGRVFG